MTKTLTADSIYTQESRHRLYASLSESTALVFTRSGGRVEFNIENNILRVDPADTTVSLQLLSISLSSDVSKVAEEVGLEVEINNGQYLLTEFDTIPYGVFYAVDSSGDAFSISYDPTTAPLNERVFGNYDVSEETTYLVENVQSGVCKPVSSERLHQLFENGHLTAALKIETG